MDNVESNSQWLEIEGGKEGGLKGRYRSGLPAGDGSVTTSQLFYQALCCEHEGITRMVGSGS